MAASADNPITPGLIDGFIDGHTISWNPSELTNGMYFYRINMETKILLEKFVIIH